MKRQETTASFEWLYADSLTAESVSGINRTFLAEWDRNGIVNAARVGPKLVYQPRDLAKLMLIAHMTQLLDLPVKEAAEEAGRMADHVVWYAVMKHDDSVIVTGTEEFVRAALHEMKRHDEIVEQVIGGKPQHHPKATPAVHRFAICSNERFGSGAGFHLVDSLDSSVGKLKPFYISLTVIDLWYFGMLLSEACGPLLEVQGPDKARRAFAVTGPAVMRACTPYLAVEFLGEPEFPLILPTARIPWTFSKLVRVR